jgi:hypothetical protein
MRLEVFKVDLGSALMLCELVDILEQALEECGSGVKKGAVGMELLPLRSYNDSIV